ncbi:unnamed protein product [Polarella glacialis]|uniref:Uncharacterized protein n=1 Tax=Polarella glacialis TaxID=89957 RepID=A0A813FQ97_POLGL|nr:unnamed protein product [Polarella glacialis]
MDTPSTVASTPAQTPLPALPASIRGASLSGTDSRPATVPVAVVSHKQSLPQRPQSTIATPQKTSSNRLMSSVSMRLENGFTLQVAPPPSPRPAAGPGSARLRAPHRLVSEAGIPGPPLNSPSMAPSMAPSTRELTQAECAAVSPANGATGQQLTSSTWENRKGADRCSRCTMESVWAAVDVFFDFDRGHSGFISRSAYMAMLQEPPTVLRLRMLRRAKLELRFRKSAKPVSVEEFLRLIWPQVTPEDWTVMQKWAEQRRHHDLSTNFRGADVESNRSGFNLRAPTLRLGADAPSKSATGHSAHGG